MTKVRLALALVLIGSGVSQAEIRSIEGGTCPFTITGSLQAGDLTEDPRLFRDDPAQTCAASDPCPGASSVGPFFYDQYVFINAGQSNCVTVTVNPTCGAATFTHTSAYLNAFTPGAGTICTDYLADIGASPADGVPKSFSFNVAAGATFVVVVNTTVASTPCPTYVLDVAGCEVPVQLNTFSVE